jgi:osmotically-inducible protein OsmY
MMKSSALSSLVLVTTLGLGGVACDRNAPRTDQPAAGPARDTPGTASDAAREAGRDTAGAVGTAGSKAAGAAETVDVKSALMLDDGVDASGINVDTDGVGKVVVLKGTVTSAAQRERAEQIAKREAPGYRVENQLMVRAK